MEFSDVRNKARIGGDDGLVNVLQAFDFQSGQLLPNTLTATLHKAELKTRICSIV